MQCSTAASQSSSWTRWVWRQKLLRFCSCLHAFQKPVALPSSPPLTSEGRGCHSRPSHPTRLVLVQKPCPSVSAYVCTKPSLCVLLCTYQAVSVCPPTHVPSRICVSYYARTKPSLCVLRAYQAVSECPMHLPPVGVCPALYVPSRLCVSSYVHTSRRCVLLRAYLPSLCVLLVPSRLCNPTILVYGFLKHAMLQHPYTPPHARTGARRV
jgi:hypothetical protein